MSNSVCEASLNQISKPDKDIIIKDNYKPIFFMDVDVNFFLIFAN